MKIYKYLTAQVSNSFAIVINERNRADMRQSIIRFSLFGNYENFSTSNLDAYMKLIQFFGNKGYKPATANELQVQPNGQVRMLVMPVFLNESGATVEITSTRINFQKAVNDVVGIELLSEKFDSEFLNLLDIFINEVSIVSNRVALNCDILSEEITVEMPTQSTYFDNKNKTEMSVRNASRKEVEKEESNIIIEKYTTTQGGFTKYSYDINSIAENQEVRFKSSNIKKMYKAYIEIAIEIEKGLK